MMIFYGPEEGNGPWLHLGLPGGGTTHHGAPWWVVPTSGTPQTASLLYKYHNIPETLEASTKYSSSCRRVQNYQIQSRHHRAPGGRGVTTSNGASSMMRE